MDDQEIRQSLASITRALEEIHQALAPIKSIRRELAEVKSLVIAPRALPISDKLIMAKLAFDNIMLIVEMTDRLIGPHIIMNGIYEKALTAYFRSIIPRVNTFVDVGANIGYYTCIFGKHLRERGQVYAFEPSRSTYEILKRNTQINWIDKTNIVIEPLAVSDSSGTIELFHNVAKPGNTSVLRPRELEEASLEIERYSVEKVALDDYFRDKSISVDVMKIDVEGFEFPVLLGARETISRSEKIEVVIEWDPQRWRLVDVSAEDVHSFFTNMRLSPYELSSEGTLAPMSDEQLKSLKYANVIFKRLL